MFVFKNCSLWHSSGLSLNLDTNHPVLFYQNFSTKIFVRPYISYVVGKLLMCKLLLCGQAQFLVMSERFRSFITIWNSNEGYISKCVLCIFFWPWKQILFMRFWGRDKICNKVIRLIYQILQSFSNICWPS